MTYRPELDRRLPSLLRAARLCGGWLATCSTPPAHWEKRRRWLLGVEGAALAHAARLEGAAVAYFTAAAVYMGSATGANDAATDCPEAVRAMFEHHRNRAAVEAAFAFHKGCEASDCARRIREALT